MSEPTPEHGLPKTLPPKPIQKALGEDFYLAALKRLGFKEPAERPTSFTPTLVGDTTIGRSRWAIGLYSVPRGYWPIIKIVRLP